jgi:hypothetical protein
MQISCLDMRRRNALTVPRRRQNPAHSVVSEDTDNGSLSDQCVLCDGVDHRVDFLAADVAHRERCTEKFYF